MLLPLVQTFACLSIINGGLYALHLSGQSSGSDSGSGSSNSGSNSHSSSQHLSSFSANNNNNNHNKQLAHSSHPPGGGVGVNAHFASSPPASSLFTQHARSRLGEQQLADMAQLERERLMLLGLAKQTAAAGNAASGGATGHHGRPFITGRIQMQPAETYADAEDGQSMDSSDYASLLLQQAARGFMFGNVVRQPSATHALDYDSAEVDYADADVDAAGLPPPRRYEYGRVVQPPAQSPPPASHYDAHSLNAPLDVSGYDVELEAAEPPEDALDDLLPDLDGYQYLDELLAEQQLQQHSQQQQQHASPFYHGSSSSRLQNPYHNLELGLESQPPLALQELFEQHQPHQKHVAADKHYDSGSNNNNNNNKHQQQHYNNMRLQQKWQRKRSQQKFMQQQKLLLQQQQQKQPHIGQMRSGSNRFLKSTALNSAAAEADTKQQTHQQQQSQQQQHQQQQPNSSATSSSSNAKQTAESVESAASASSHDVDAKATAAGNVPAATASKSATNQQQKEQQQQHNMLHPNHKRSGLGAGVGGASSYTPMQAPPPPPITHSIASQLMLRSARGQRQYDVPQIECPTAMDGMERFACPTPDLQGRYRCIDDHVLCDGFIDCPEGEDEDRRSCMFYKTTKAHLDVLADALLRWARGR